jgi:hypothetical protein
MTSIGCLCLILGSGIYVIGLETELRRSVDRTICSVQIMKKG